MVSLLVSLQLKRGNKNHLVVLMHTCLSLTGQGECHNMSQPSRCPANNYIFSQLSKLQASTDAAITTVSCFCLSQCISHDTVYQHFIPNDWVFQMTWGDEIMNFINFL